MGARSQSEAARRRRGRRRASPATADHCSRGPAEGRRRKRAGTQRADERPAVACGSRKHALTQRRCMPVLREHLGNRRLPPQHLQLRHAVLERIERLRDRRCESTGRAAGGAGNRPHLLPAEHCGSAKVVPHVTDGIVPDVVRLKVLRSLKQLPIQPHIGCSGGGRHRLIDTAKRRSAETDSCGGAASGRQPVTPGSGCAVYQYSRVSRYCPSIT